MKFVVEHVSKGGGRLGRLSGLRSQPDAVHNTPFSLITTKGGSAPHLTQDVLHLVAAKEAPLCIPAQHFYEHIKVLQSFKKGVAHFAALQSHSVSVVVQDPATSTPSGYNKKQGVSTWGYCGRHVLNADSYMNLVEAMQPDWYEALNDADTPMAASKKRLSNSLTQSRLYVNSCIQRHKKSQDLEGCGLLIPLLGGHNLAERERWSKEVVSQWVEEEAVVGGFTVQGIHTNGAEVELLTVNQVIPAVKTSLELLPEGLPCQAGGGWSPEVVVSLVEAGVDIFDSSFPYLTTERNGALIFPHQLHIGEFAKEAEDVGSLEHQNKKLKVCKEEEHQKDGEQKEEEPQEKGKEIGDPDEESQEKIKNNNERQYSTSAYEICLNDNRFVLDERPILNGCECYTCKNFSCAYINHLINVREMLGPVLLMIHNLHHWNSFFVSIREAIKTDRLQDLKMLVSSVTRK